MGDGLIDFLIGGAVGLLGSTLIFGTLYGKSRIIPSEKNIEPGYVQPSKLEFKCEDFNGNKLYETIIKYKGNQYLFQEDENGKPVAYEYEIMPIDVTK